MKEVLNALVGFAAACLVPPLSLSALARNGEIFSFAESFLLLLPFSIVFVVGLGLPAFLLLRRFAPGRWWSVGAAGLVLGALTALLVGAGFQPRVITLYGAIGVVTALVFWLIWRRGQKHLAVPK